MNSSQRTEEQLRELFLNTQGTHPELFQRDSRLQEDLGLDSMEFLALATAIENHFRIQLKEHEWEGPLVTLGDLCCLIDARLEGKNAAETTL